MCFLVFSCMVSVNGLDGLYCVMSVCCVCFGLL